MTGSIEGRVPVGTPPFPGRRPQNLLRFCAVELTIDTMYDRSVAREAPWHAT